MKKVMFFINKRLVVFTTLLLVAIIAFYITSCNKKDFGNNIARPLTVVSGISINTTDTLYLLQGKDSVLPFTVTPDSAYNKALQWTTTDSSIATVKDGNIHAAALGTTIIAAGSTDGTLKSGSIVVSVIDHITPISALNFSNVGADTSIYEGDMISFNTVIAPSNATYKTLRWSSSNASVATVSETGTVKAVAKGEATITATAADGSGISVSININVLEVVPVQSISITSSFSDPLAVGELNKLSYAVTPVNATVNTLIWSSSAPSVVSVAQDGTITVLAPGQARISVTSKYDATITAYIDLVVVAGKIDDEFNGITTPWLTPTAGATGVIQNGKFVVTMVLSGTKYRGDFQRKGGAIVDAGAYPIIAFKMERPAGAAGGANITFDTNLGSFGNGSNKFSTLTAGDGTTVYYYNIATGTFGSATTLSTTATTTLTTFQLKMADLVLTGPELADGGNIYHVDWVKSFSSVAALQSAINN